MNHLDQFCEPKQLTNFKYLLQNNDLYGLWRVGKHRRKEVISLEWHEGQWLSQCVSQCNFWFYCEKKTVYKDENLG